MGTAGGVGDGVEWGGNLCTFLFPRGSGLLCRVPGYSSIAFQSGWWSLPLGASAPASCPAKTLTVTADLRVGHETGVS